MNPAVQEASLWQAFVQQGATVPAEARDYPEWRRGRIAYAVWAVMLDISAHPAVLARYQVLQTLLAQQGWLLSGYVRQPHITVHVCGFAAETSRYDDDFTAAHYQQQCAALQQAQPRGFTLEIGGFGSFASAPYVQVQDPEGGLAALRSALALGGDEWRETPYHPHLTLGLYGQRIATTDVAEHMTPFLTMPPLSLPVRQLELLHYDSRVMGGALQVIETFPLRVAQP